MQLDTPPKHHPDMLHSGTISRRKYKFYPAASNPDFNSRNRARERDFLNLANKSLQPIIHDTFLASLNLNPTSPDHCLHGLHYYMSLCLLSSQLSISKDYPSFRTGTITWLPAHNLMRVRSILTLSWDRFHNSVERWFPDTDKFPNWSLLWAARRDPISGIYWGIMQLPAGGCSMLARSSRVMSLQGWRFCTLQCWVGPGVEWYLIFASRT